VDKVVCSIWGFCLLLCCGVWVELFVSDIV
jgi:hypothetical protein